MPNKYQMNIIVKNKEKIRKEASERYENLSEEEQKTKIKKPLQRYQNFSEEEKEKSVNIIVNVFIIVNKIFLKIKNKGY